MEDINCGIEESPEDDNECREDILFCGRCFIEVGSKDELYPANCNEKPEELKAVPLGMYHCPDCGAMVVAGIPHPPMCKQCFDRNRQGYDY